jgi:tetratricopeptide (TPR) repeat protein
MGALEPRWGGDYETMQAFAEQLRPLVARRPLLQNTVWAPQAEYGFTVLRNDQLPEAVAALTPVADGSTRVEAMEDLAGAMLAGSHDDWRGLVLLLEASRFSEAATNANWNRGELMLRAAQRPDLAIRYLEFAVAGDPDDGQFHLYLGRAYAQVRNYPLAEAQLQLALRDAKQRPQAMNTQVEVMMHRGQWSDALAADEALTRAYPDFGPGWYSKFRILSRQHDAGAEPALRQFLKTVDRRAPAWRALAERYESLLAAGGR